MVLSAKDMGIREGLDPLFCSICGDRIGWVYDDFNSDEALIECEHCARREKVE